MLNENEIQNKNPIIFLSRKFDQQILFNREKDEKDDNITDEIDNLEIYDLIKGILDPEHPLTLEQLNIVNPNSIIVDTKSKYISVRFTPTIPTCSMSTLIGLMLKVKLINTVSSKYKIDVVVEKGKHEKEEAINKQLNDKERILAALEMENVKKMVYKGIKYSDDVSDI